MFARRIIIYSFQRKCHVTNIYTVEEKQKYHITFFCEKNKSIILHHVLPNSPENVFRAAFVMLKLQQQCRNCQTKYRTVSFQVKEENKRFIWLSKEIASLHANKMFLNGNAIADELPNIQFCLTTVRDTSLPGIQTYFIYSSRIIGRPPWISIKKFGRLSSKFSLYSLQINGKP